MSERIGIWDFPLEFIYTPDHQKDHRRPYESPKRDDYRGRETGHMSRARKKRVRTVSSRFYFASCPFLFRISGTGEWRKHGFRRFLTYSALLQPSSGRDTR